MCRHEIENKTIFSYYLQIYDWNIVNCGKKASMKQMYHLNTIKSCRLDSIQGWHKPYHFLITFTHGCPEIWSTTLWWILVTKGLQNSDDNVIYLQEKRVQNYWMTSLCRWGLVICKILNGLIHSDPENKINTIVQEYFYVEISNPWIYTGRK